MRITIRSTNQNIRNDDTQEPKDNIRNNKYEAKVTGILGSQKKVVSNSRLNFYSSETSLLRRKVEFLISLEQLLSENTPPITRHMQSR
jgi:hypothetical protein